MREMKSFSVGGGLDTTLEDWKGGLIAAVSEPFLEDSCESPAGLKICRPQHGKQCDWPAPRTHWNLDKLAILNNNNNV